MPSAYGAIPEQMSNVYDDDSEGPSQPPAPTLPSWAQGTHTVSAIQQQAETRQQEKPSAYKQERPSEQAASSSVLQQKEYMLKIKEDKLKAQEEDLKRREDAIASGAATGGYRMNNWPTQRYAFVYHDINVEIPEVNRGLVRLAYFTWILTAIGYVLNWFVMCIAMFSGDKELWEFFVATLVVVIGIPASFICWYKWGIYAAARTSGGFIKYGCFFLNFLVHFAWIIIMIIAVPVIAQFSAGALSMIDFFDSGGGIGNFLGIVSVICMVLWGVIILTSLRVISLATQAFRKIDLEAEATDMAVQGAARVARKKLGNDNV
eukprot:TRINITY_DN36969_c0_g1_i1.p1 TRINITY_DN36969_c0_g1~~TRINITY_DN36969_c0_g1_i1.p1  ORF type:complete len:343 (-),score=38.15 TRINITY_DN36969_c0_g1_i1:143-1099(-)